MRNPTPGFLKRLFIPKEKSTEDESKKQEEQEENKPEIPEEILDQLDKHDLFLNRAENRKNALGQIAKEIYQGDSEKEKDIASVKIGQGRKLRGEQLVIDQNDQAGFELESQSGVVNKFLAFVKGENRHRIKATPSMDSRDSSTLDKRKLAGKNFRVKHTESLRDFVDENLGVSEDEIFDIKFYKKFETRNGKIVETLSRDRAESEQLERARELVRSDIERINNKFGADLISNKEALEKHNKSKEEATKLLASLPEATRASISQKIEAESTELQEIVDTQKEALEVELAPFREPMEEKEQELSEAVNECSGFLQEVDTTIQTYKAKTRELALGAKKAARLQFQGGIQTEIVKALEDQKAEADLVLAAFKDRKVALENRLKELKKEHGEVARALTSLKNIGKTKAEIKTESEDEEKRKKEAKEKKSQSSAVVGKNSTGAEDEKPKSTIKLEDFGYPGIGDDREDLATVSEEGDSIKPELDASLNTTGQGEEEKPEVAKDSDPPVLNEEEGAEKIEKKEIKRPAKAWLEVIKKVVGARHEKEIKSNVLSVGSGKQKHYEARKEFFINPSGQRKANLFSRLEPFLRNILKYNDDQVRNALETIEKEAE